MSRKPRSDYQNRVIAGYYSNLDAIMLGKLEQLVSELYLAETVKKRNKLWSRAEKAMVNLKVPVTIIEHIMTKRSVEILAKNLQDWLGNTKK
ncbi:hypothetical protein ACFL1G_04265 [Planctomycetota bacterium]